MTLATRIAVMNEGEFVQMGSPTEIYEFPENRFVADFIGSANIFEGKIVQRDSAQVRVATDVGEFCIDHVHPAEEGGRVWVAIRPEKIHLSKKAPAKAGPNQTSGIVEDIGYLGNSSIYKVRLKNGRIIDITTPNQIRPKNRTHQMMWEDTVYLDWKASSAMLFDK